MSTICCLFRNVCRIRSSHANNRLRSLSRFLCFTKSHESTRILHGTLPGATGIGMVGCASGLVLFWLYQKDRNSDSNDSLEGTHNDLSHNRRQLESGAPAAGQVIEGLPNFTLEEVSKHKTSQSGIWVLYGDGVYDITDFVASHPGGIEKIMLAAGKSLESFWEAFPIHKKVEVCEVLEEWRIGNLAPNDRDKQKCVLSTASEDLYANDPERSPVLIVDPVIKWPFWGETPTSLMANTFITPNNIFYVRNHFPVPQVDPKDFALEISGEGINTVKFTLEELKEKLPQYTVTATIQCAGNKRSELFKVKPLNFYCQGGYIGNAEWKGVRLRDVLLYAGLKESEEYTPLEHVHFEGPDYDVITGERYGASIPIHKAMDRRGDCILAYEMNGEELPRDHGYPLRAVVPGTVGARNVKWLSRIVVSRGEHGGLWQQINYKGFPPSVNLSNVDYSSAPAIQEMPVQSIIYSPEKGATLEANNGVVTVSGIAWSGGGRGVIRVDVSCDGGKTWKTADLLEGSNQTSGRAWAWTLWKINVQVPSEGEVELCCKAVDSSYNVQPDTSAPLWNMKGYLSNAWHRIPVKIK